MTFHLMCVHIILVRFRLLSGHLLGNSCSFGWPYVLFVFWQFVILVITRFGFDGWIFGALMVTVENSLAIVHKSHC